MAKGNRQKSSDGSALDFEAQLWAAADKMRGHMDASEYKHVCLGLIFLKYISDAFEEKRVQLLFSFSDPKSEWFIKDEPERAGAAENRDEYLAANVFWVPPEARWHTINARAKSPEIGKVIDDAMGAIERENPSLKGVLPRDYARPSIKSGFLPSPLHHFTSATLRRFHRRHLTHATDFFPAARFTVRGGVSVMAEKSRNSPNKTEDQPLVRPPIFPGYG